MVIFYNRSAGISVPFVSLRAPGHSIKGFLVGVEHPLNIICVRRLGKRERKQQPRFPRLQVVVGDEAAPLPSD